MGAAAVQYEARSASRHAAAGKEGCERELGTIPIFLTYVKDGRDGSVKTGF